MRRPQKRPVYIAFLASFIVLLIAGALGTIVLAKESGPNVIQSSGGHLLLDGSNYQFAGVNTYEAATDWGVNAGCGADLSDKQLNELFSSLPPNSLVRFWAFQGTMATNARTGRLDWKPIDRVFAVAAAHGQRLIPVITDQGGTCDGDHWQDPAWYNGGFKTVYNDPQITDGGGSTPLSYWIYLKAIVNRYKDSPALGMWEPISEAEASTCPSQDEPTNCSADHTCPNEAAAAAALRHFFNVVGGEIHVLDPDHLVENGLLGGGQCGIVNGDYKYVSASPGVDVLAYHDYYGAMVKGSTGWKALDLRLKQAVSLHKPIIAGEVGIQAGPGAGCVSLADRNVSISSKERLQIHFGLSGFLVWDWTPDPASSCSYDVGPLDPLMRPGGAVGGIT